MDFDGEIRSQVGLILNRKGAKTQSVFEYLFFKHSMDQLNLCENFAPLRLRGKNVCMGLAHFIRKT
jgi:hypothetical protein